ncbi:class I SAM-dependent methyltransferase [Candidatus Poribacteria bacterium]|nr:class I SAM-dependent methyltransferase [Candidatus Poribacteria bacterium]
MVHDTLEIGAGDGRFAEKYLPDAVVTDGDSGKAHNAGIDVICRAEELSFLDNAFQKVVAVNPYEFGFRDEQGATSLLTSVGQVLRQGGLFNIYASGANPHCQRAKVARFAPALGFAVAAQREIDPSVEFPGHVFRAVDGHGVVRPPTLMISLRKL